jgi:hypothetical protein
MISLILNILTGSDHTVESIRTKIIHIQDSYKAANDKMIQSAPNIQNIVKNWQIL